MADITWTDQALADVEAVCLYIARDAPRYAELFARRIFQTTDRLVSFPRLGRVVPEIGRDDIREVIV
jgi:plasmid stabilization system protein ParE